MANARFQEYVTSGAFNLTLSRNQISALSLVANGEGRTVGVSDSILERKGLVEPIANPGPRPHGNPDAVEFRPTVAGFLCMEMLREANLINFAGSAITNELAALRAEVEERRREAATARERAISAMARKERAEGDLAAAQAEIASLRTSVSALESGLRWKDGHSMLDDKPYQARPMVRLRDPIPGATDAELRGGS